MLIRAFHRRRKALRREQNIPQALVIAICIVMYIFAVAAFGIMAHGSLLDYQNSQILVAFARECAEDTIGGQACQKFKDILSLSATHTQEFPRAVLLWINVSNIIND